MRVILCGSRTSGGFLSTYTIFNSIAKRDLFVPTNILVKLLLVHDGKCFDFLDMALFEEPITFRYRNCYFFKPVIIMLNVINVAWRMLALKYLKEYQYLKYRLTSAYSLVGGISLLGFIVINGPFFLPKHEGIS